MEDVHLFRWLAECEATSIAIWMIYKFTTMNLVNSKLSNSYVISANVHFFLRLFSRDRYILGVLWLL